MELPQKRSLHAAQSLLPHLWGAAPESIRQVDEYELPSTEQSTIHITSLHWQQERQFNTYWFLGTTLSPSSVEGSTALLPLPYQLPKWERIHFNRAIETPVFREKYSISSTAFMHSYYTISRSLIEQFLTLANQEAWLMIYKNKVYLAVPKQSLDVHIQDLDAAQVALEKEGLEALALGKQFSTLIQQLAYPTM